MVARAEGKNLLWREIETETISEYYQLLQELNKLNIKPLSFTIDGRLGVRQLLLREYPNIPIQHCHFHQQQTITQCISRRPQLPASQELRTIALTLTSTNRKTFAKELKQWHQYWQNFLKEKTFHEASKRYSYTHRNLRRAYFSLKRNLSFLFTYQDYHELNIPNTTNSCDGSFAHWKAKVKLHRGLAKQRRLKMINYLLSER